MIEHGAPRVFISYSHDTAPHKEAIRALAERLRDDGIDCRLDQWAEAPAQGWPAWMEEELESADFVLVVSTEAYRRKSRVSPTGGSGGSRFESILITQELYSSGMWNERFLPVLLADARPEDIVRPLRPYTYYRPDTDTGYESLYRRVTCQPEHVAPELGERRSLPPREPAAPRRESSPPPRDAVVEDLRRERERDQRLAEIEWVEIDADSFTMGDDNLERSSPMHLVTLSRFRISRHPITNEQYRRFLVANGEIEPPPHWIDNRSPSGSNHHPVTNVSWGDAKKYCSWRTAVSRDAVDLPTEAQWEFAARGKGGRSYPWGAARPTASLANYGSSIGCTTSVDRFPEGATPEGVWGMAGNVWEWCLDWYDEYSDRVLVDPIGPQVGTHRVLRGGCFINEPANLRSPYRYSHPPDISYGFFGFRVVSAL